VLTNDAAEVTVSNFNALFYTNNISWAQVQRGRLRLVDGQLFTPGPRTVALIAETVAGYLSVDNVAVQATNASGPLIAMVTAGAYSIPGRIATQAGNTWTYTLPGALTQTFFSPVTTFQNGAVFANLFQAGRVVVAGPSGAQNGMVIYRGATIGWTMQSTGVADDFFIGRWNDAGALVDNPIGINRATGAVTIPSLSAAAGSFSTLSASTTVSGAGFTSYMAAPPAIGGTTAAAGTFTNLTAASGIKFSGTPSAGYDTSKHVNLDGAGTAGLNLQGGVVNMVVPTGSNLTFYIGTGTNGFIDSTGLNFMPVGQTGAVAGAFSTVALNSKTGPTIRAGTGAATGTQPSGSLWLRTDGTTANRLYVTSGGGTWLAVAGV
jgi:hypothetical protein